MFIRKSKAKKTNNAPQKNENEHAQIVSTRWFTQQKRQARNEPKNVSIKTTTRQKKKQIAE